ncbi:MAG: CPBP family intramembrane metalloprotease [Lachnospiraceae bacterium]|nr:CPBP family intramembrane metalloprotease [Lachnospiraceae bacterium]
MEKSEKFNKKLFIDHLLITFPIMLICWGLCIVLGLNGITISEHPWIFLPYGMGAWSTTIASYIALKKNDEVTGFKDWLKNVFDFRHNGTLYIVAIGIAVLQALMMCILDGYEKVAPIYMIILSLPIMFIGGGIEEVGWRYITFPELDKKFGFFAAAIITGMIWALWHLPLFFIPGVNQYGRNFAVFTINVIGASFGLAAIRKAFSSVWLCILCHMFINAIPEVFRYDLYGSYKAGIITTVVLIIVSSVIVRTCKTKNMIDEGYNDVT